MRTFYCFQSGTRPELQGFTDDATGRKLPPEDGPWTLAGEISPDAEMTQGPSRRVVAAGILENGFCIWEKRASDSPPSTKPVIESDRVEGTAVFGPDGRQIGTIKRLMIEKVSGKVLYVDVTFGGFLGLGTHHHTIPWEKLSYDTGLHGYRTDITEEQVRAAPAFTAGDEVWPDHRRERETQDYWRVPPTRGMGYVMQYLYGAKVLEPARGEEPLRLEQTDLDAAKREAETRFATARHIANNAGGPSPQGVRVLDESGREVFRWQFGQQP